MVESRGRIAQVESRIRRFKENVDSSKDRLKEITEDMQRLKIVSPVDGIITFGDPRRARYGGDQKELKVGVAVNANEILGTIPDLSKFMVQVMLPEDYRSKIKLDLSASLRSPAFPDLVMEGKIREISPMAVNIIRWDQNSPKVYETKIFTDSADKRLMPGMTVKVEIVSETVANVLYAPVEAVYHREGSQYCRVKTLTGNREVEVETGRSSIHYVEIVSGLEEGQTVLLQRDSLQ